MAAIIITNSICWKRFERASLGQRSAASLSWMFRQTNRFWKFVFRASVSVIVARYGITEGVLVIDDSEKKWTKQTKRIDKAHKVKDRNRAISPFPMSAAGEIRVEEAQAYPTTLPWQEKRIRTPRGKTSAVSHTPLQHLSERGNNVPYPAQ